MSDLYRPSVGRYLKVGDFICGDVLVHRIERVHQEGHAFTACGVPWVAVGKLRIFPPGREEVWRCVGPETCLWCVAKVRQYPPLGIL